MTLGTILIILMVLFFAMQGGKVRPLLVLLLLMPKYPLWLPLWMPKNNPGQILETRPKECIGQPRGAHHHLLKLVAMFLAHAGHPSLFYQTDTLW